MTICVSKWLKSIPIYLSIHPYPSVYLLFCPSVYLSICLSLICLHDRPSIHPSIYPINLLICFRMNVAGYANEIGEAFKSHIPRAAYLGSYVVSSSYCLADSISKGLAVHRVSYLLSISFVPLLCPVALKASTERLHPSLLPTWRPVSLFSLSGT